MSSSGQPLNPFYKRVIMKLSEAVNMFVKFLKSNKNTDSFLLTDDFILARTIIRTVDGLEDRLVNEVYNE